MKIVACADLHGNLPEIEPCDFLLIGGDICPHFPVMHVGDANDIHGQAAWLGDTFKKWLDKVPAKHIIATWGNHDWVGERLAHRVPLLRWNLLVDKEVLINRIFTIGRLICPKVT